MVSSVTIKIVFIGDDCVIGGEFGAILIVETCCGRELRELMLRSLRIVNRDPKFRKI